MSGPPAIRRARRDELEALRTLERDAGRAFAAIGMPEIAGDAARSAAEGRLALTLTTFRDVPWNAPYFRRLGFVVVEPADQGFELEVS